MGDPHDQPAAPSALAHVADWMAGTMYAAPISRNLVEPTAVSVTNLVY